jgi:exonuclease III
MAKARLLAVATYNCRGYNSLKQSYIVSLLNKVDILFLQEHWLSESQFNVLSNIHSEFMCTAVSGFDNIEVLSGRPYGGCAILWRCNLFAKVHIVDACSKRLCALRFETDECNLLLINCYVPYGAGVSSCDDFVSELSSIEVLVNSNVDCHCLVGGDFNVDFGRDRSVRL